MIKRGENKIKTLIVTGGSSGIGKEFIRQYSNINKNLWVINLSRSKPENLEVFYKSTHLEADFSSPESAKIASSALLELLKSEHFEGEVMLVNNSGIGSVGDFADLPLERELEIVDINIKAPMILVSTLYPFLKKHGGCIVNISSTASYQPTPGFSTYGASKAFLTSWSLGLWKELAKDRISVVTVCPGPTSTAFFDNAGMKGRKDKVRHMTVEKTVEKTIEAVIKGSPLVICGFTNRIIASIAGMLPNTWITRIAEIAIRSQKLNGSN